MHSYRISIGTWTLTLVSMKGELAWWDIFVFIPCLSPTLFVFSNHHVERLDLWARSGGQEIPPGHSSEDVAPNLEPHIAGRDTVASDLEPTVVFFRQLTGGGGRQGGSKEAGRNRRASVFLASHREHRSEDGCCV